MSKNSDTFKNIQAALDRFPQEVVNEFLPRVVRRTPRKSGKLQAGWEGSVQDGLIEIKNEVDYAPHIEFGTRHIAPVGMLRATANEAEQIAEIAARKAGLK